MQIKTTRKCHPFYPSDWQVRWKHTGSEVEQRHPEITNQVYQTYSQDLGRQNLRACSLNWLRHLIPLCLGHNDFVITLPIDSLAPTTCFKTEAEQTHKSEAIIMPGLSL